MSESKRREPSGEDLYAHWLGLAPGSRPPDHYALLGVPRFCEDVAQIEEAAHQRLDALDRYALHPDPAKRERCQQMMNEVARARTTLASPERRLAYATSLGYRPPRAAPSRPAAPKSPGLPIWAIPVGAVAVVALVVGAVMFFRKPAEVGKSNPPAVVADAKPRPPVAVTKPAKKPDNIFDPASFPPAQAPDAAIANLAPAGATSDAAVFRETALVGGKGGAKFVDLPTPARFVVGVKLTTNNFFGGHVTVGSIQPLFLRPEGGEVEGQTFGRVVGEPVVVRAPRGYALGGLRVGSGLRIDRVRFAWMRIKNGALDPRDVTWSDPYGGLTGNGEVEVGSDGVPVVGLAGRAGADLDAIGLVQLPAPASAVAVGEATQPTSSTLPTTQAVAVAVPPSSTAPAAPSATAPVAAIAARQRATSRPAPQADPAGTVLIEAQIDGNSQLHVTPSGVYWKHGGNAAKPGRHTATDMPTFVNGKPWMPVWSTAKDTAADTSSICPVATAPGLDYRLELISVRFNHGEAGIDPREQITLSHEGDELVVRIPDGANGHRWYKFALVPKSAVAGGVDAGSVVVPAALPRVAGAAAVQRDEEVAKAIAAARQFIYSKQVDGAWEDVATPPGPKTKGFNGSELASGQWGATTALAAHALLASGEPQTEPHLRAAIEVLRNQPAAVGDLALAYRIQVWAQIADVGSRQLARRDLRTLLDTAKGTGAVGGYFDYLPSANERADRAVSAEAMAAVAACAAMDVGAAGDVPEKFWKLAGDAWLHDQGASGGWTTEFKDNARETPLATAGGVAALCAVEQFAPWGVDPQCAKSIREPGVAAAFRWLDTNFAQFANARSETHGATLRAITRACAASGRWAVGGGDWGDWVTEHLLATQEADGSWSKGSVTETCLSLAALAEARVPVAVAKLEYGPPATSAEDDAKAGRWNERPRDVPNFTRWLERQVNRREGWAVAELSRPREQWPDAPVLLVAGSEPLSITAEEEQKLRTYVQDGGLIVFNGDCGKSDFLNSALKLGKRLFPAYEFRRLPDEHPMLTLETYPRGRWKDRVEVVSMSNGARELLTIISGDPARYWHTRQFQGKEWTHELMGDVVAYATDAQKLRPRGAGLPLTPDPAVRASRTLKLARLQYDGNWDPEPGGGRRLAATLHDDYACDLSAEAVPIEKLSAETFPIAHWTGTRKVTLNVAQSTALKAYVDGGGTLFVDACGGSADFAASAEYELSAALGKAPAPLSAASLSLPVKIETFEYRRFARRSVGQAKAPRVRGITVNGRTAVYVSPDDLSVGLVGEPVDGINGYDPETAAAIVRNVVLRVAGK